MRRRMRNAVGVGVDDDEDDDADNNYMVLVWTMTMMVIMVMRMIMRMIIIRGRTWRFSRPAPPGGGPVNAAGDATWRCRQSRAATGRVRVGRRRSRVPRREWQRKGGGEEEEPSPAANGNGRVGRS